MLISWCRQVYWCGPIVGGVLAGLLYETTFAANASRAKARAYFLQKDFNSDNFEPDIVEPVMDNAGDSSEGDMESIYSGGHNSTSALVTSAAIVKKEVVELTPRVRNQISLPWKNSRTFFFFFGPERAFRSIPILQPSKHIKHICFNVCMSSFEGFLLNQTSFFNFSIFKKCRSAAGALT